MGWKFCLTIAIYAVVLGLFKADGFSLIFGGLWYYISLKLFDEEYTWKDSKVQ